MKLNEIIELEKTAGPISAIKNVLPFFYKPMLGTIGGAAVGLPAGAGIGAGIGSLAALAAGGPVAPAAALAALFGGKVGLGMGGTIGGWSGIVNAIKQVVNKPKPGMIEELRKVLKESGALAKKSPQWVEETMRKGKINI